MTQNKTEMPMEIWVVKNTDDNIQCDFVADVDRFIFTDHDKAIKYTRQDPYKQLASEMAECLSFYLLFERVDGENTIDNFERIAKEFHKQTGFLRPGKDCVIHSPETRRMEWDAWFAGKADKTRETLKKYKAVLDERGER